MPEAIEETLLEVCFGELFLVAADAPELLFEALALELALFVAAGFAAPLFDAVDRVTRLLEAVGFALLFGAAARAALLLLLDVPAFAPPAFPPREPAVAPPVLRAIFQLSCIASRATFGATDLPRWLRLASGSHANSTRLRWGFGAGNFR
jgi:hypothetical protein